MSKSPIQIAWSAAIGPGVPGETANTTWCNPAFYVDVARILDRAGVEFLILDEAARLTMSPVVIASAIAPHTRRLGLVPTMANTDYPPFKLARTLATLIHVTHGRIGWSMDSAVDVRGAWNYGLDDLPRSDLRYEIATEYVEVIRKLWDSWEPGCLLEDAEEGVFADASKVKPIHHDGTYFRVRGPLNTMTEPQGNPLVVQEAADEDELLFGARTADVVVVRAPTIEGIAAARARVLQEAASTGRPAPKVYFAVSLHVGFTPEGIATWPSHGDDLLRLEGDSYALADLLEAAHDDSGCDGVLIHGDWSPVRTVTICNDILATLRRRGRIGRPGPAQGLTARVTA